MGVIVGVRDGLGVRVKVGKGVALRKGVGVGEMTAVGQSEKVTPMPLASIQAPPPRMESRAQPRNMRIASWVNVIPRIRLERFPVMLPPLS